MNLYKDYRYIESVIMLSIKNPPNFNKIEYNNNKKIYTINNRNKNIFSVRIQDKNKTDIIPILTFAKEYDAIKIASMLEYHYLSRKEWPNTIIDINSNILLFSNHLKDIEYLEYLEIKTWDYNDFNEHCINNLVDYLYITEFKKNKDNNYNIKGQIIKIDQADIGCAQILDNIYNKS
jgi:hypothetical protein